VPGEDVGVGFEARRIVGDLNSSVESSTTAKIEWIKKKKSEAPYFVEVPDILKSLSFIEKDSKRFPNTHGWAYAQFDYDTGSKTFKPSVTGPECGYTCHSKVASRDYIWTAYPLR
jgi:hypothetical protein